MSNTFWMVFDVESIGLHGQAYAVAYVVIDTLRTENLIIEEGVFSVNPDKAAGTAEDRAWVKNNVPAIVETHDTVTKLRKEFWRVWLKWKERGASLAADVCWPVEAKFLSQCVEDNLPVSTWEGPYPLYDIASMNIDAIKLERNENELPEHDPLADTKHSARLLLNILKRNSLKI